ncbi:hypothetical protein [uncultured Sphingomonas sp.]|nr:hypothetical protein [uncultured Sphingomonas sp.]
MSYPPRQFPEMREAVLLAAVATIGLAALVVVQGGASEAARGG